MKRKIVMSALLILLINSKIQAGDFACATNVDNTITIIGYVGSGGDVIIPETIDGLPVTSIGAGAFSGCSNLADVTVSSNVIGIGDYAFSNCQGLTNVMIPNSVVSIGDSAFSWCGLTRVTIPESVTNVGFNVFACNFGLTNIVVASSNMHYSSLNGVLFNRGQTRLVAYPCGMSGDYAIPGGVSDIGDSAFTFCFNLTGIVIPGTVTNIERSAFYNDYGLTNVTIPQSVIKLGDSAFGYCYNLTNFCVDPDNANYSSTNGALLDKNRTRLIQYYTRVDGEYRIPEGVAVIGAAAFAPSFNLTSVIVPGSVTNIEGNAFFHCYNLIGVYYASNAPGLSDGNCYFGANNVTNYFLPGALGGTDPWGERPARLWNPYEGFVYITNDSPASVTITGYDGAAGSITIPDVIGALPVSTIGQWAFAYRADLSNVVIGNGVTFIEDQAFRFCTGLACVVIPGSVKAIGSAFGVCTGLTNVFIGEGVTNISQTAFVYCDNLASIDVSSSNMSYRSEEGVLFEKSFGTLLRYPPAKAGKCVIPNTVTNIGTRAFQNCYGVTNIIIPASVCKIGEVDDDQWTFVCCTNLLAIDVDPQNAYFSSTDGVLFNKDMSVLLQYPGGRTGHYRLPDGVGLINDSAFEDCLLSAVTIPGSVGSIGKYAFFYSSSLRDVYFKGNAPSVGNGAFDLAQNLTAYYLPGTTGWGNSLGGRPALLWNPSIGVDGGGVGIGVGGLKFSVSGTTNIPIVVQACTNLLDGGWVTIQNSTLSNGSITFSDPAWTNYPGRFYRIATPY